MYRTVIRVQRGFWCIRKVSVGVSVCCRRFQGGQREILVDSRSVPKYLRGIQKGFREFKEVSGSFQGV